MALGRFDGVLRGRADFGRLSLRRRLPLRRGASVRGRNGRFRRSKLPRLRKLRRERNARLRLRLRTRVERSDRNANAERLFLFDRRGALQGDFAQSRGRSRKRNETLGARMEGRLDVERRRLASRKRTTVRDPSERRGSSGERAALFAPVDVVELICKRWENAI